MLIMLEHVKYAWLIRINSVFNFILVLPDSDLLQSQA